MSNKLTELRRWTGEGRVNSKNLLVMASINPIIALYWTGVDCWSGLKISNTEETLNIIRGREVVLRVCHRTLVYMYFVVVFTVCIQVLCNICMFCHSVTVIKTGYTKKKLKKTQDIVVLKYNPFGTMWLIYLSTRYMFFNTWTRQRQRWPPVRLPISRRTRLQQPGPLKLPQTLEHWGIDARLQVVCTCT